MVGIDNQPYLDGALSDSIPLYRAIEQGYKKNVVILTRNIDELITLNTYQKGIYTNFYRKNPELVNTILKRLDTYKRVSDTIHHLESNGDVFVIRPEIPTVRRFETDSMKLERLYYHGYNIMEKQYKRLSAFLNNEN